MKRDKLIGAIASKGMKKKAIAKELGISVQALNKKLNGRTKITVDDALKLCEILNITSYSEKCDIFLS